MPLNDSNYIEEGDSYSLFYWKDNDWVRADGKTASRMGHIQMNKINQSSSFEKALLKKDAKSYTIAKNSIHLYGYQTITYHGEDSVFVNKLWKYYKDEIDKLGHFYVMDGKVRVYFPPRNAIVRSDGETL